VLAVAGFVFGMIIAPLCKPQAFRPLDLILGARHSHDQRRAGRDLLHRNEEPTYIFSKKPERDIKRPERRMEKGQEKTFEKR
jgi:hypothetical protein